MKTNFRLFIYCSFTISGAFGLIYEVIWQRNLSLIFGATLPATTAVLTAFMGGLAIGSWYFGKIAYRLNRPFYFYGLLQIGIGVFCLGMPGLFHLINKVHILFYHFLGDSFGLEIVRFFLSTAILIIPCALMGGTLPVLSRALITDAKSLGKSLSVLYFVNTLGASAGTLVAGFFLIRYFGMIISNTGTATLSILLGLTLCIFSSRYTTTDRNTPHAAATRQELSYTALLLPMLYSFTGAAAMGTQIAWTRSLNLVLGSTVYAFSLMLASFLLGIALGSLVIGKQVDNKNSPITTVGVLSFCVCISIALSIALISRLPVVLMLLFPRFHSNFFFWQACLFFLSLLVVFPATFFMGALFPAFGRAYIQQIREVGRQVGNLYVWNTVGAIAGTLFSGFILIPRIGTRSTLLLFASVYLLTAIGLLMISFKDARSRIQVLLLMFVTIAGYLAVPAWEPDLLDSGVYVYAPMLQDGFESNRKILFDEEGYHSHVTVSQKGDVKSLRINGKTDGSDGGDLATQVLLAVLPLMHLDSPDNALIVGLGTGVTAGSALNFTDLKVDCVEIDDAVITASRYFDHVNGKPFSHSLFSIIHADARIVLGAGKQKYDSIISEPSNPWITGVSNLFTLEYFQAAYNQLSDSGIMCQWIHSYYMDTETLMIIFKTFQTAFPYCSLWEGSFGDYLILGSDHDHMITDSDFTMDVLNTSIRNDLARIEIFSSSDFLNRLILRPSEFKQLVHESGARLNTDNHPIVEFNAPMSLYHNTVQENKDMIVRFQTQSNRF